MVPLPKFDLPDEASALELPVIPLMGHVLWRWRQLISCLQRHNTCPIRGMTGSSRAEASSGKSNFGNGTMPSEKMPQALHERIHYRPDIDGLRAIAVFIVIFYHYGVWPWTGGVFGARVFFLFSGFLISSIIYPEVIGRRF